MKGTSPNMETYLNPNPSEEQLTSLLEYLLKEYEDNGKKEGFYCNRNIIKKSFDKGYFITLDNKDKLPIAFAVYTPLADDDSLTQGIELDIINVHQNMRNKGIAKHFLKELENHFKNKQCPKFTGTCISDETVKIFTKMGFENIEDPNFGEDAKFRVIKNLRKD